MHGNAIFLHLDKKWYIMNADYCVLYIGDGIRPDINKISPDIRHDYEHIFEELYKFLE